MKCIFCGGDQVCVKAVTMYGKVYGFRMSCYDCDAGGRTHTEKEDAEWEWIELLARLNE